MRHFAPQLYVICELLPPEVKISVLSPQILIGLNSSANASGDYLMASGGRCVRHLLDQLDLGRMAARLRPG